mmetsp:Transcript_20282/g.36777  ORF Transcript_20282/g.36777 Transcript_20282/m.36777 type:complete len:92 (+) Transcript_20282:7147-7422(+)
MNESGSELMALSVACGASFAPYALLRDGKKSVEIHKKVLQIDFFDLANIQHLISRWNTQSLVSSRRTAMHVEGIFIEPQHFYKDSAMYLIL